MNILVEFSFEQYLNFAKSNSSVSFQAANAPMFKHWL